MLTPKKERSSLKKKMTTKHLKTNTGNNEKIEVKT